ncbi:glycoside hydrolase family 43 protein [Streptomyces sp. V4-01]|uniref:Glycoside hydrolase family 43 protein n=1 Tax=Actinacidiphila polyblastidii TaxID=3110430 RepID=A0ABU7PDF9_9ACTN|nr:glycoside hydrolase family 43 protein [Streptomyces sp. V4-01]
MTLYADNPVLPGCHPDPSVCRVGQDYYLANSSFEFFPGIPLHHSRDLVHWRPIGHAVDRPGQLALGGVRASGGLYAPTLRHAGGRFHLVCTLVDGLGASGNFLISADDPAGAWSDPVWLPEAPGFDPSLFFDDDGSAYLLGTRQLDAAGHTEIWLRSLDLATGGLTGPDHVLFRGALRDARWAEGPHLYRYGGAYYLVLAEGGTEYEHAVTVARSRHVTGPYLNHAANPVLTHRHLGLAYPVSGVGHADLVETPGGDWYAVLLGSRMYGGRYANLGRETFVARVVWEDGWPVVNPGVGRVEERAEVGLTPYPWPSQDPVDRFEGDTLGPHWNTLRGPLGEAAVLTGRPGRSGRLRLRLLPRTLAEPATPAFVCRRQQHIDFAAETALDFEPAAPGDAAGLAVLQNPENHLTALVTLDGQGRKVARLTERRCGAQTVLAELPLQEGPVRIGVQARGQEYTLSCVQPPHGRRELGTVEGRFLSSQAAGGFTGVVLGPYATGSAPVPESRPRQPADQQQPHRYAEFDWFRYEPAG